MKQVGQRLNIKIGTQSIWIERREDLQSKNPYNGLNYYVYTSVAIYLANPDKKSDIILPDFISFFIYYYVFGIFCIINKAKRCPIFSIVNIRIIYSASCIQIVCFCKDFIYNFFSELKFTSRNLNFRAFRQVRNRNTFFVHHVFRERLTNWLNSYCSYIASIVSDHIAVIFEVKSIFYKTRIYWQKIKVLYNNFRSITNLKTSIREFKVFFSKFNTSLSSYKRAFSQCKRALRICMVGTILFLCQQQSSLGNINLSIGFIPQEYSSYESQQGCNSYNLTGWWFGTKLFPVPLFSFHLLIKKVIGWLFFLVGVWHLLKGWIGFFFKYYSDRKALIVFLIGGVLVYSSYLLLN